MKKKLAINLNMIIMIGELLMEKMIKNNRYNNRLSNLYLNIFEF